MKKTLSTTVVSLGLAASMATTNAASVLTFINGGNTLNSASDTLTVNIDTSAPSASGAGEAVNFNNNIGLSGTSTVDDTFTLTINAGFGWDPSSPTWDTTDSGGLNVLRIVNTKGLAPNGDNADFGDGEILWFSVSGLDAGNTLELNGFTMEDDGGAESGFLNYYTEGATPQLGGSVTDGGVTTFGSALSLSNGDRFGIGWKDNSNTANRSALQTLDFDITAVPEPSSAALLGLGGLALIIRRRK